MLFHILLLCARVAEFVIRFRVKKSSNGRYAGEIEIGMLHR
jgi:hypothetical protein